LNVSSDGDDVTVAGKLFHTRAATTGKAQSPAVDKRVEGTLSASVNDGNVVMCMCGRCCGWCHAGVRAATECVARSRSEQTQDCACRLLRSLADGNPKFQPQVYRALTALLSASSAKAQHLAAQTLRIVQVDHATPCPVSRASLGESCS